ncbi:ATP-dependent zinc metalloprotease FtsH 2 [termite gut metagenome]|uniref:ATP-dependent zinc metalloprotease FtsH 2 n=1 Tax=termite gut metagenome TaxID=433724 RepID=A0A5J4SLR3_9ZZZZ
MNPLIIYIETLLTTVFALRFGSESKYRCIEEIPYPGDAYLRPLLSEKQEVTFEERILLIVALLPHISPQTLDLFFMRNTITDRPHTEFGGWTGTSHSGFLPTGETAAFVLAREDFGKRQEVVRILNKDHWFYKNNILRLEGQGEGEPFLSGKLCLSEEIVAKIYNREYEPEYNASFPAKRITTPLDWSDLILPYNLMEELSDTVCWIRHQQEIREQYHLNRIVKPGYRCLFYGPPGTGKTLTATLLGKQNGMDVYRVDLSGIVSKYIGETEKNLAKVFDKAEHQNWILFFDEADALFGQRTDTQSSNDRHANQEVAYLLQRIEDFPGMVILATNLKENIDDAFFRRFQSALYFPVPDQRLRYSLWQNMLPAGWLGNTPEELLHEAASFTLSGGSMVNVVQTCALKLYEQEQPALTLEILKAAIRREQAKEGTLVN